MIDETLKEYLTFSWEVIRKKLEIRLIHTAWNREFLQAVPYKEFLDLSMVMYMESSGTEKEVSYVVDHQMMLAWGIREETLFDVAFKNMWNEEFIIRDMEAVIQEMEGKERIPALYDGINYVLTNRGRYWGARGILRTDILCQFSDFIGSDLYILPNTVHDLVLIPVNSPVTNVDLNEMMKIIREDGMPDCCILRVSRALFTDKLITCHGDLDH